MSTKVSKEMKKLKTSKVENRTRIFVTKIQELCITIGVYPNIVRDKDEIVLRWEPEDINFWLFLLSS